MSASLTIPPPPSPMLPDRGYHALVVKRVVRETADAVSLVFDIPPDLADRYRHEAGQFVTLRVVIDDTQHFRCYSMSSAPAADADFQITVKRVPGGTVSNWLNEVAPRDVIDTAVPTGEFVLDQSDRDLVAFAGGSGITPVLSIVKTALATSTRRVRLLYANRTRDAVIFHDALTQLVRHHADRFELVEHIDDERGLVTVDHITDLVGTARDAEFYLCGPAPFMDIVETALGICRVPDGRVRVERFSAPPTDEVRHASDTSVLEAEVTVRVRGRSVTTQGRKGDTILQTARSAGLPAPSSCEMGECATCMARVVEGSAMMRHNGALTPEEVVDGWVLTCQAEPTSPSIRVVYE